MNKSYRSPDERQHTLWESVSEMLDALVPAYGSRTVERRKERGWMFRGQSDDYWDLAPTLYRKPFTASDISYRRQRTEAFIGALRANAVQLGLADATDDELVAIAQHYGFPTAHLDFTYNNEVAAFFASATNPSGSDVGVIYCFNVEEYRQMQNPFSVWGVSLEKAEETLRDSGLTPLPPLKTVQLENVPRVLKQEAVFLEVHEQHLDSVMHNCIERFYFKHIDAAPFSGGVQSRTWTLPDRSSFRSDHEYSHFLKMAQVAHPEVFERTPYVGQDVLFPEDDEINRFVHKWKQANRESSIQEPVEQHKGPSRIASLNIAPQSPKFKSLLAQLPHDLRQQLGRSWEDISVTVDKEYTAPARTLGMPGKWINQLTQHVRAAWELDHVIKAEKHAKLSSTPKSWEPFAARLWDMPETEVSEFDFETQRPNRVYFRSAIPLTMVATILRRALPELLERVSMPQSVKEDLLGFSDEQMLRGPYVQLASMLADRFLQFLSEDERWELWATRIVPVGSVFVLDENRPFLNPNLVYRCGFP